MQHGVCRMFADTTAPHLTTTNSTIRLIPEGTYAKKNDFAEKTNDCDEDDDDYWTGEYVDDGDEDSKSTDGKRSSSSSNRPSNHSEIEKRRRDKMNNFITEIATIIPSCAGMSRRMDKLTVLRLAVQHIKCLKGSIGYNGQDTYKPSYVSDDELQELISQNCSGFVICVNCDTMKIVYVSNEVQDVLGFSAEDLTCQNFLCLIDIDDLETVKRQVYHQKAAVITSSDSLSCNQAAKVPREWSTHRPGSKRSFYCRMKKARGSAFVSFMDCSDNGKPESNIDSHDQSLANDQLVHCKGFLKSCSSVLCHPGEQQSSAETCPTNLAKGGKQSDGSTGPKEQNFLILLIQPVIRSFKFDDSGLLLTGVRIPLEFTWQISQNGRFIYVDHSVTSIFGYTPHELIRTSYFQYIHKDDVPIVNDMHRKALEDSAKHKSPRPYRIRSRDSTFVRATANWRSFRNPWNGEFQFLVIQHRLVAKEERSADPQPIANEDGNKKLVTLTQLLLAKDDEARNGHASRGTSINQGQWS